MNDHDDAKIDAAIEALARQEPAPDHVARILARTGPAADEALGTGVLQRPPLALRPRWVLPMAAAVLVALGATWQLGRQTSGLDAVIESAEIQSAAFPSGWGTPEAIDRPVLPPQAYWGMDAFDEWDSLRSGVGNRESRIGNRTPGSRFPVQGAGASAGTGRQASSRAQDGPVRAWVPVPSGLPPIELESIVPAPLVVAAVAPLEDIALADIPLVPIVIDPIAVEEKP